MIVRDPDTGKWTVRLSREEFSDLYHRWQEKAETKKMFAEIAAERKANVARIMSEINARRK